MSGPARPEHLVVGHVTKPHGTRGELFVWPLTDQVEAVFAEGRSLLLGELDGSLAADASEHVIERTRAFKRGVLVAFEGIEDRNSAEPFAGRYLLARRESLDEPGEDEVYYHDLVGLEVVRRDGGTVGTVREVYERSPADLLDVECADGERRFVPLMKPIVDAIDLEHGRLVIDPPPGLLEL